MSAYILQELLLFLKAAGAGAFFLFFYDFIRGFREAVPHKKWGIGIEDLFFWISCAFGVFQLAEKENYGEIRTFLVTGILIGVWGNWYLFHRYWVSGWEWFWKWIVKIVKKMRKRLLFPLKRCKISMYQFAKLGKIGENRFRKLKRGSKIEK